ncbi:MAG: SHD1 domain-containing protein [Pirellulaceae bacterium]
MRLHHIIFHSILLGVLILSRLVAADDPQPRTWKDATGSFSVVAAFVDVTEGKVQLKREDGTVLTVPLEQLSSTDQQYVAALTRSPADADSPSVAATDLTGKPQELRNDDGEAAGKKSFPRGIASTFKVDGEDAYLTAVRVHGGRYGTPRPPKEDFHVTLCDENFNKIADFAYPYSKFERADPKWVTLRCKPTKVPREFVICLNFDPTATKGVYVSHDKEGTSLVGLPGKRAGKFTGGDWMLRVEIDTLKPQK